MSSISDRGFRVWFAGVSGWLCLVALVALGAVLPPLPAAAGTVCDPGECCPAGSPAPEGTECGSFAGVCDLQDTCDGLGLCVDRGFEPGGETVECRAGSGDLCDPTEYCDGNSPVCPDDVVAAAETSCREQAGLCDVGLLVCSGNPLEACPVPLAAAQGSECRVGSGDVCDPTEVCDGNSTVCPDDVVAAAATSCRDQEGLCDVGGLACSGNPGEACPVALVAAQGTECRAGSGDQCDPTELCDGASTACPADIVESDQFLCNPGSGDSCDPDEFCTGVAGATCPDDFFEPSTTVCLASDDETCDPAEVCPGEADSSCPADVVAEAGTACGLAAETRCTNPDSCDGSGACNPNDVTCGLLTDVFSCPVDVSPNQGTCVDAEGISTGEACDLTLADTCASGTCEPSDQFPLPFVEDPGEAGVFSVEDKNFKFQYNAFYDGAFPATVTVSIPFPFVTNGVTYLIDAEGARNVEEGACLQTQNFVDMRTPQIEIGDYLGLGINPDLTCDLVCDPTGTAQGICVGGSNPGATCEVSADNGDCPDGSCVQGGFCSFDLVDLPAPPSGALQLQVGLSYGLEGDDVDANPCDDEFLDRYEPGAVSTFGGQDALASLATGTGPVAIPNLTEYDFAHSGGNGAVGHTVQNQNDFPAPLEPGGLISYGFEAGQPSMLGFKGLLTVRPSDGLDILIPALGFNAFPDSPERDIDAIDELPSGEVVFSTASDVTEGFGGLSLIRDGDVVMWDGATASVLFSEDAFGDDQNVDGFAVLPSGNWLISTEGPATLGGLAMQDGDVVEYNPMTDEASLFMGLSEAVLFTGDPQSDADIDALSYALGLLVFSIRDDGDGMVGTNFAYQASDAPSSDLFGYDPATGEGFLFLEGEELFDDPDNGGPLTGTRNLDAVPEPSGLMQLLAGSAALAGLVGRRRRGAGRWR